MSTHIAVIPAVMTLFLCVFQVSLWLYGRSAATAAAQHGLDAARLYRGGGAGADEVAGAATVAQFFEQVGGVKSYSVTVEEGGGVVCVKIQAEPLAILPFFSPPIRAHVEAPLEDLAA